MKTICDYCGRDITNEQNYYANRQVYCNKNCYKHKKQEIIRQVTEVLR